MQKNEKDMDYIKDTKIITEQEVENVFFFVFFFLYVIDYGQLMVGTQK